jgi:D-alanine-D-alanine ligase-like ATP-grasp enzyme
MFINDDQFATYKLLWPEFEKQGYSITTEVEDRGRYISFTSKAHKTWRFRASRIGYPFTSLSDKELSVHKEHAYEFAESIGVHTPFTKYLDFDDTISSEEISTLLSQFKKLIVKPSSATLSRGLTLNITTEHQLLEAITHARTHKDGIVIQEQVEGEEIRFITIKGKVQAALLRRTARVVGDGKLTIAQLIEIENKQRAELIFPYVSYPQLTDKIIDPHFFTSTQVLEAGYVQELNKATMIKNGSSIYNVLSEVHPSYIEVVEKLAFKMDTQFIAIDFFFADFTKENDGKNYWFLEFNTSPVLKLCYGCRDGKMYDVIPELVNVIDEWLHESNPKA